MTLDFPAVWEEIPTEPDAYTDWVRNTLGSRQLDPDQARTVETALRTVLVEARAAGLVLAAGFVGTVSDESDRREVLTAHAFASVRSAGEMSGKLSSVAWLAALADAERRGDLEVLAPPQVVTLGDLEAVKAVVLDEVAAEDGGPPLPVFASTYYAAIADGTAALVLGFRTPCVWLASEFDDLFDDIAATLRVEV